MMKITNLSRHRSDDSNASPKTLLKNRSNSQLTGSKIDTAENVMMSHKSQSTSRKEYVPTRSYSSQYISAENMILGPTISQFTANKTTDHNITELKSCNSTTSWLVYSCNLKHKVSKRNRFKFPLSNYMSNRITVQWKVHLSLFMRVMNLLHIGQIQGKSLGDSVICDNDSQ